MCGIAGFISSNPQYDASGIVQRMLEKINHRGPDGFGYATFDDVTLGMVRLSIIDTEEHPIPLEDTNKHYAIVYNGEIYNHDSIRSSLRNQYQFQTGSDTETALISYMDAGVDSFGGHNGMYTFAIYDKLLKETIIVRDKTGEKPLYYTQGKDFFAFSSEIKALLELVEPRFHDATSYRAYEFTVGKETLFHDIYQLEPGEYIKVKRDQASLHNYWKIWEQRIEIEDNEKNILNHLADLVEDSILLRTKNAAYSHGAFISGGVDSSLVACIAKPEFIYTAHYDFPDFDELDYARLVAQQIGRELRVVQPTKDDFLRTRENVAYALDTPCTWTSFTLWCLMERASQDGVKIIQSGDGADEVFAGYHRYHLLHHDEQIHQLEAMKQYSYLINRYYGSPVERYAKLVNRCDNIYDQDVMKYLHETIGFYFEKMDGDVIHLMGLNDFYSTMQVLLQMADRVSMAFSIENRAPFLDYRLIQFAFSLPSHYKIKNGITKWALKEVAKRFIPKEIAERIDKRGFSAPVNKWFEWTKAGKYDRSGYRNAVLSDWKEAYQVVKD